LQGGVHRPPATGVKSGLSYARPLPSPVDGQSSHSQQYRRGPTAWYTITITRTEAAVLLSSLLRPSLSLTRLLTFCQFTSPAARRSWRIVKGYWTLFVTTCQLVVSFTECTGVGRQNWPSSLHNCLLYNNDMQSFSGSRPPLSRK
jgi:hypothetical protein